MVFLRELNRNLLAANHEGVGLSHESAGGPLGGEELNDGEPLDGSVIGTCLVLVFWDVDVAEGAMLLKDIFQFVDGDVAGQIAGHNGLDPLRIVDGLRAGRENRRGRRRNLLTAKLHAIQLRIDRSEIGRAVIRLKELVQPRLFLRNCLGVIPLDIAVEHLFKERIVQGLRAENNVELLKGSHGRMDGV